MDVNLLNLAFLMNIANVFDLISTKTGLERGFKEANPIARGVIQQYGFEGLSIFKLAPPLILTTLAFLSEGVAGRTLAYVMAVWGIVFAIASINNIFLISFIHKT